MKRFWEKRIIDAYISKEVFIPFLVGVAIVTIIMLSSFLFQLTDFIIIKKIPVPLVLRLLAYKLPDFIVQTFPISILFATLSGMGRLNRENEFTALRMGGISIYRLILPLAVLGMLVSGITYIINEEVVPWSNHQAQNIIRRSILKQAMPDIQENVFFKGPEGRLFYVKNFNEENNTLDRVVIYNFPDKGLYPEIITASSGRVENNKWILEKVIYHRYDDNGQLSVDMLTQAQEYEVVKDIDRFFGEQRTSSEMSRERLKKDIELFSRSGINVDSLLVDYHLKLAMPLAALIFILVGTPLSLSSKDSRSASITFTIVVIFMYYLIVSLAQSLGKNGEIPPLLAAWLPNLLFAIIGVMLLIWQETWQNWLNRIFSFFLIPLLFMLILSPGVQAADETLKVQHANEIIRNQEGQIVVTGDVLAQYRDFHIHADKVIVKLDKDSEEVLDSPEELIISPGKFSGCDQEDPHYFFDAREVIIHPGEHLIAKHVVYWELNGKLPLFYWPYLYISLKDRDQRFVPEVGYNASRGYFIKTTYYYLNEEKNLPGEIYFDFYTISGLVAGFKHYFVDQADRKGFVYLSGQENRTDLPGLYTWEGEFDLDDREGEWQTDTNLKIKNYDDYRYLAGTVDLDYYKNRQNFQLNSSFNYQDFFMHDYRDERTLSNKFKYSRKVFDNWQLNLDYDQKYVFDPEESTKNRWGGTGYLSKKFKNLDLKITLARTASNFNTEKEVNFYRWPEIDLGYNPYGPLSYKLVLGRYYEGVSNTQGYRGLLEGEYNLNKSLTDRIRLNTKHVLQSRLYNTEEIDGLDFANNNEELDRNSSYLYYYDSYYRLRTKLANHFYWDNTYQLDLYQGESPFSFDKVSIKERVDSSLNYNRSGLILSLGTGYDIYNKKYSLVRTNLTWRINPEWNVRANTSYNLETQIFNTLTVTNKYEDPVWQIDTKLTYDLNDMVLKKIDNSLVYDLKDEWYLELNTDYDQINGKINEAELVLRKNFHCRQLIFGYDHLKKEYLFEYRINLFPDQGVKVGSSEEEPFIFDLGIKELNDLIKRN